MNWQMMMVAVTLKSAGFADLLAELPDTFYSITEKQRDHAWRAVLTEINAGERDPRRLAAQAMQIVELVR